MDDPIRKPRKLKFMVSTALLVSAPMVAALGCGEDPVVNTVDPTPIVEQPTANPVAPQPHPVMEPQPQPPATNVVADPIPPQPIAEPVAPQPTTEAVPEPPPRPRMVNTRPMRMHTVNPAPSRGDDLDGL